MLATRVLGGCRCTARRALGGAVAVAPSLPEAVVWRPCDADTVADAPVCVVFGYTSSTQRQLAKYAAVYQRLGVDCATWACPPREVLRPQTSRDTAARLLDALHGPELGDRPIILKGLSAGAYSIGNLLLELDARCEASPAARDAFYARIRCAVYDCPVDFDGVPKGVSSAMLGEGSVPQKIGESLIRAYLSLVDTEAWEASSAMFHAMPPRAPSLWIYSQNDEILDIPSIEKMMGRWRDRGDDVQTLVLPESPHVKNLLTAPEAYAEAVAHRVGATFFVGDEG